MRNESDTRATPSPRRRTDPGGSIDSGIRTPVDDEVLPCHVPDVLRAEESTHGAEFRRITEATCRRLAESGPCHLLHRNTQPLHVMANVRSQAIGLEPSGHQIVDRDIGRDRLARLLAMVRERERDFVAAIDRDFGHRSSHETRLAERYIVTAAARHALANLRRWMRARRIATPIHLLPGSARIVPQPLGVAGVVSPWNYPVQLALAPAIGALAAGNRVMLKPSEVTPATYALLAEAIAQRFAPGNSTASGARLAGDTKRSSPTPSVCSGGDDAQPYGLGQVAQLRLGLLGQRAPDLGDHITEQSLGGQGCLLYTSPSPRDRTRSRMPSSA